MESASAIAVVVLAFLAVGSPCIAQTTFVGIEPNDTKALATPAFGMRPGDQLGVWGLSYSSPPGIFRVRLAPAPLDLYRHELRPISGIPPTVMSLLGRSATVDTVDPQSSVVLLSAPAAAPTTQYLTWYGFGRAEEFYVDLSGPAAQRSPAFHVARLTSAPVVPRDLGSIPDGPLWIAARDVSGARDLELHVFDSAFDAVPRALNDESATGEAALALDLAPGLYHFGVAGHECASHLPPTPSDLRTSASVLDFAGAVTSADPTINHVVEIELRQGPLGPLLAAATATKVLPYEVLWFRVQVGSGQDTAPYCAGDGSVTACGCAGDAPLQSGMGCLNSTGRGATAIAADDLLLSGMGRWELTFEDLPAGALALGFVSVQLAPAAAVSGGLSCIGAGAVRVGPINADPAGTARIAGFAPLARGFLVGQTLHLQGAYRDTLAASGCALNFTSGFAFVVR